MGGLYRRYQFSSKILQGLCNGHGSPAGSTAIIAQANEADDTEKQGRISALRPLPRKYDQPCCIVGLEILQQVPDVDGVLCSIEGGSLLSGVAVVMKTMKPDVKVIVIESNRCASFASAKRAGKPVFTPIERTLADGLAVPTVGYNSFVTAIPIIYRVVVYEEFAQQYSNLMMMYSEEFEFRTPPEAPVFEPTDEEFKDPFAYINKFRPIAEKSGICKIRPPAKWQPPFALDVDKFKFTPRVQRLNELEAKTRIKINFLDQIAKFWELQGSGLKIPVINKKVVDLYSLYDIVDEEDGVDCVNSGKKWENVARKLGYPEDSHVGGNLKHYYEKILYPYSVFQVQRSLQHLHEAKVKQEVKTESKGQKQGRKPKIDSVETGDAILYKPRDNGSRSSIEGGQKNNGTTCSQTSVPRNNTNSGRVKYSNVFQFAASSSSKELKRLQFFGPGPKMAGFETVESKRKTRNKKVKYNFDPLAKYICHNCGHGDGEESMLLCDGCDDSYHTYCLIPPLREVPKGDWQCPQCVAQEVDKPMDAFGFEQARREYTLRGFGKMADKFKSEYFNMPVDLVPGRFVEKEFWRIAASIEEDVIIEYGADLHTMDHGSGFPTRNSKNLMPVDEEYVKSPWNLNNLPILDGSVLSHIGGDVSGMKIAWMYVGICFSTFCWHIEDHWSYSIKFLHWGEAKTWYGVPGSEAEHFESVMKSAAPELFRSQPDLLHQLVTLMNPNILMDAGVPVVRTDQKACEFVITFPRSYHCGFNQGFNLGEAVNFAPPDWLKIGRECILHYANFKRYCVFSHDELVCTMGANTDLLSHSMAGATYDDLLKMIINEKKLRKSLCEWGVKRSAKVAFEIVPDDERQCEICKTTCFLSAVACSNCNPKQVACLRHYRQLCDCPSALHIMKYRYTLEELESLLIKVKCKAELADNWSTRVREALEKDPGSKIELEDMKELVEEAKKRKYPNTNLLNSLTKVVSISEKCVWVAKKLLNSQTEPGFCLTLLELQTFVEELTQLPCNIKETGAVRDLLANVMEFQKSAETLLEEDWQEIAKEALAVEKVTDALAKMSTVLQNPGEKTAYGVSCGPKKTASTLALGHEIPYFLCLVIHLLISYFHSARFFVPFYLYVQ